MCCLAEERATSWSLGGSDCDWPDPARRPARFPAPRGHSGAQGQHTGLGLHWAATNTITNIINQKQNKWFYFRSYLLLNSLPVSLIKEVLFLTCVVATRNPQYLVPAPHPPSIKDDEKLSKWCLIRFRREMLVRDNLLCCFPLTEEETIYFIKYFIVIFSCSIQLIFLYE